MKARLLSFGEIEIEGERYPYDILIERGAVRKRKKAASKAYRDRYGHTPLSAEEEIPWAKTLYIGTGMYGALPVMPELYREAERRGTEVVADKTEAICRRLERLPTKEINAILHLTC